MILDPAIAYQIALEQGLIGVAYIIVGLTFIFVAGGIARERSELKILGMLFIGVLGEIGGLAMQPTMDQHQIFITLLLLAAMSFICWLAGRAVDIINNGLARTLLSRYDAILVEIQKLPLHLRPRPRTDRRDRQSR